MTAALGVGGMFADPGDMTRSDRRSAAAIVAEQAPQRAREILAERVDRFCEVLLADMDDPDAKGHRTALTLYAQVMRMVGAEQDLVRAFLAGMGLSTVAELESRVALARSLDGVDSGDADAQGVAYFRRRMRADPAVRERLRRELFGELGEESAAVVLGAGASVANGNGACSPERGSHGPSYESNGSGS